MEGQGLTPLLVFILPHSPSKYIGSSRDRSAVSTQVANAMTTTSDDTPSPFSRSVGPLITHLPNSTLQRLEEKHLPRLERKAQITFSALPAVKHVTIKRPPFYVGSG